MGQEDRYKQGQRWADMGNQNPPNAPNLSLEQQGNLRKGYEDQLRRQQQQPPPKK